MRRFLTGGIALLALVAVTPSQAANYNWNGFYVGGNVGYSWGKSDFDYTFGPGAGNGGSGSSKPKGVLGGVGAGFNWQNKQLLLGLEADIQVTGQKGDSLTLCTPGDPSCTRTFGTVTQKLPMFGTFRGRIGYVSAADDWLLYVTGGLAWGRLKTEATGQIAGVPFAVDASTTKTGSVIGGGVEKVISKNWTVKLEYLYVSLGTVSQTVPFLGTTVTSNSSVKDSILRLGVNYKF
jgi:outer membrane immunogenic protein